MSAVELPSLERVSQVFEPVYIHKLYSADVDHVDHAIEFLFLWRSCGATGSARHQCSES